MNWDFWKEIWLTIKQQKMRSLMTAFGVFWGILILTLLIGCGVGFVNGMRLLFAGLPSNSIIVAPMTTTMAYGGYEAGRQLKLTDRHLTEIERQFAGKLKGTSVLNIAHRQDGSLHQISWKSNAANYEVGGVTPSYINMMPHKVTEGRYINDIDIDNRRKVCVIGEMIQQALFGEANPVGERLSVDDMIFTIIGVCKSTNQDITMGINPSESVLLPLTTEQLAYGQSGKIDVATFVFDDAYPSSEMEPQLVSLIQQQLHVSPDDKEAMMSVNLYEVLKQIGTVEIGINLLIWIVGLGTLLAGLIGISNIMMVTVSERTQEIGVRRALGARPRVILRQIMSESLLLTIASGITGLSLGTWLLYLLNRSLSPSDGGMSMFDNPYMPYRVAIMSLLVLIVGGIFAGWVPAKRAIKIKAIDALRAE